MVKPIFMQGHISVAILEHATKGRSKERNSSDRSDRFQQKPAQVHPVHQEYRVKEKKDELEPMQVDSEKVPDVNEVQVEDGKGKAQDAQKGTSDCGGIGQCFSEACVGQ